MMASGVGPVISADPTSFIVPSPPHAITSRAPRATAAAASSLAWPRRSETTISAASPHDASAARASSTRRDAACGPPPPEIGLMMTVITIRNLQLRI
jgi:hypothetical protein